METLEKSTTATNGAEFAAFVIEKGVKRKGSRGPRAVKHPDFFRMKETMARMERENSFLFPLNGHKLSSVKGWVKKIQGAMNENILDARIRERNPIQFSMEVIKDALGIQTGVRIFRDN